MGDVSFLGAIHSAMCEEMRRDSTVFLMGEDVRENVYGSTGGMLEEFGAERVLDTPISEAGFVGAAAGAAMVGMRPIVDVTISPFLYPAYDQIVSIIAKSRYLYGGQATLPLVIRCCMFYGSHNAAQHSDRPYTQFAPIPGLKLLVPSNPYDAKGLLKSAIRDDDPVICFEDGTLWGTKSTVPDDLDFLIPIGKADVKKKGTDLTLFAVGGAVRMALAVANKLESVGISIEVIDPRTVKPLDTTTVLESVAKTGRFLAVDPAHRSGSIASEICAVVAEEGFWDLKAPVRRVTTPDNHIPFSPSIEKGLFPTPDKILAAIKLCLED